MTMIGRILVLSCTLSALSQLSSWGQTAGEHGTLIVRCVGFKNDQGKAVIKLFRSVDKLPDGPHRQLTTDVVDGKAVFAVEDLASGDYAAIVFHDRNANGKIDHRFGFPAEPLGFSNGWKLSLFSGMPTFSKLKFHYSPADGEYEIALR
jgi:uncharacterized protein (DUF2141 family)